MAYTVSTAVCLYWTLQRQQEDTHGRYSVNSSLFVWTLQPQQEDTHGLYSQQQSVCIGRCNNNKRTPVEAEEIKVLLKSEAEFFFIPAGMPCHPMSSTLHPCKLSSADWTPHGQHRSFYTNFHPHSEISVTKVSKHRSRLAMNRLKAVWPSFQSETHII